MASPTGRALFKKKEGILAVSDDQTSVTWTPLPGQGQAVSLAVANITSKAAVEEFPGCPLFIALTWDM